MPIILSTSNIIIDYGASNFTMETVKSYTYTDKDTVGITSNLLAEPYLETASRMYPPRRIFDNNNITISSEYIVSIYSDTYMSFFITNKNKVYACGSNSYGQLGVGDSMNRIKPTLINFNNINISKIAVGADFTFFITDNGSVYSCGYNGSGQLGLGDTTHRDTPTLITNLSNIKEVAAGSGTVLFLQSNGNVYGCGYSGLGTLGFDPSTNPSIDTRTPIYINSITNVKSIALSYYHAIFLKNDGTVYGCGYNFAGQLGLGHNSDRVYVPTYNGLSGIVKISTGTYGSIAINNSGGVYSWGTNYGHILGIGGVNGAATYSPTYVSSLSSIFISDAKINYGHTLFLTNTGKVYCCGGNTNGQLGLENLNSLIETPVQIQSLNSLTISAIASGQYHSLFLTNNNKVYSCGKNQYGQLGYGYSDTNNNNIIQNSSFLNILPPYYGNGLYTVSYSSFTTSFEPFRCFNNNSSLNNPATWAANNYTSGTGVYNKTLNLVSGYNGDWLVIKFPVSIKLKRFDIKQISSALNRAPKNFRLYGSINGSSWTLLVDKTNAVYTDLFYVHTDMTQYPLEANQLYNHFGLVVNSLLGTSETTLSFDELFIYGSENVTGTRNIINSTNKSLSFTLLLYDSNKYPDSDYNFNLFFPSRTFVNNISNNSNIILEGNYILNIDSSKTEIIPNGGQKNIPVTSKLYFSSTTNIEVNYHLLNPLKDPKGAQWTYSSENNSVYQLGNVGIGTKTPIYPLHIDGDLFVSSTAYSGSGQTSWTTISDIRLKENIEKASYDKCYDNVKNIELYRFKFKDNTVNTNDINQLGFIAQEVQSVYPKAIEVNKIQDKSGELPDLLSLNTTQIKYTLYGAFKHLIEKVETLEEKLQK